MKTHGSLQNLLSPAVISLPRPQLTWSKCWINWEFILSNLIISVILSNTANHWNPLWNLTNVPLGPTNTPYTVFLLSLHGTLAPVQILGSPSPQMRKELLRNKSWLSSRPKESKPSLSLYPSSCAEPVSVPSQNTCTSCVISCPRWGSMNVKVKQCRYKITVRSDLIFPLLWVR